MPTYAYECEAGHEFDLRQGFHDEPIANCPTCGQPTRRVFHPASVHYKGSGFYTTDYARKSSPSDSDSDSGSGDSGSSAGKSDSSAGKSGSSAGKSGSSAGKSGSSAGKSGSSPSKSDSSPGKSSSSSSD